MSLCHASYVSLKAHPHSARAAPSGMIFASCAAQSGAAGVVPNAFTRSKLSV